MKVLVALLPLVVLSGCQTLINNSQTQPQTQTQSQPSGQLVATLMSTKSHANGEGRAVGGVEFRQLGDKVRLTGVVADLSPNQTYAIHIHENGNCGDKGKASGGHFNPHNNPHGHPDGPNSHAGDLPNITANEEGFAVVDYTTGKITTQAGKLTSIGGRAVIVHAGADDYVSQPSGDAGERIACGVIR